jgi:hypothetical protein
MLDTNFSPEDLKRLPLRAIVAFAARCARRAEQATEGSGKPGGTPERREVLEVSLRLAEDVANGRPRDDVEAVLRVVDASRAPEGDLASINAAAAAVVAAHVAASAWYALGAGGDARGKYAYELNPEGRQRLHEIDHLTADLAALGAFTAAQEGAAATHFSDRFIQAAIRDYETLLSLNLGSYPEAGQPIDPSPQGPLGPL